MKDTSGTGNSIAHVWGFVLHMGAVTGTHLQRGIDIRSYDSESIRWDEINGPPGVPGVGGADTGVAGTDNVPAPPSGIFFFFFFPFKNTIIFFFWGI